eukprot:9527360-Alexandrium_andersonii.AAC.1
MATEPHRRPEVGSRTLPLHEQRGAARQRDEMSLLPAALRAVRPSTRRTSPWLPRGRSGRIPCLRLFHAASVAGPAGASVRSPQGR